MNGRPRQSLGGSGLPMPSSSGLARRKSGIPTSPGPSSSPTKKSSRNEEISQQLEELQAAIRAKNPASFVDGPSRSSHASLASSVADAEDAGMETLMSPRSVVSPPAGRYRGSHGQNSRPTTPTTPSFHHQNNAGGRPVSMLSASRYAASHALPRAVTPSQNNGALPQTPSLSSSTVRRQAGSALDNRGSHAFDIGDKVQALGYEGTLRYLGPVEFKPGEWGGIKLSGDNAGRGKNDGSVQGVQYFACPPNCGIFVPATKIEALMPPPPLREPAPSRPPFSSHVSSRGPTPRKSFGQVPPSTVTREKRTTSEEASKLVHSKITAGSKASSYLNLTAAQLKEQKAAKPVDDSQQIERPGSSLERSGIGRPSSSLAKGTTPKPLRYARPSIGGSATPGIPRKSIGGGTPTPTAGLRKPSVFARPKTPEVPPLPSGLVHGDSRPTAGTPAATPSRKFSNFSRPTTPATSNRPSSRLSQMSGTRSVSRASSRISLSSSRLGSRGEEDEVEEVLTNFAPTLAEQLKDAKEQLAKATRDAEQARLEAKEMSADLRDEQKRIRLLQAEVQDLKRDAAASRLDEASAVDERHAENEKHGQEVSRLTEELKLAQKELAEARNASEELETQARHDSKELEKLRADASKLSREKEEADSTIQKLQLGGKELVDIYERRVQEHQEARIEAEGLLWATEKERDELRQQLEAALADGRGNGRNDINSTDAILAASMAAGRQLEERESAIAIDNDNLRAELEHTQKRLYAVEEQLDDARAQLESQLERADKKKHESGEATEKLRNQLQTVKDQLATAKADKEKAGVRVQELEHALSENVAALERERAELESLRGEKATRPSSPASTTEQADAKRSLALAEKAAAARDKENAELREQIERLEEELKLMEEIRDDTEPAGKRSSPQRAVSSEPTDTDSHAPANQHLSPYSRDSTHSATLSPLSSSLRSKRDSGTSVQSSSSAGRRSSVKGEASIREDENKGLKILVKQLTDERAELEKQNNNLREETEKLRTAAAELEKMADSLMKLEHTGAEGSEASASLRQELKDLKARVSELEAQKHQLEDEVSQLGSIIEVKILREDELESYLADTKRALALANAKLSEKSSSSARDRGQTMKPVTARSNRSATSASETSEVEDDGNCEICSESHSIEECPYLAGKTVIGQEATKKGSKGAGDRPYCDDCDSYDHSLADCPLANELETF